MNEFIICKHRTVCNRIAWQIWLQIQNVFNFKIVICIMKMLNNANEILRNLLKAISFEKISLFSRDFFYHSIPVKNLHFSFWKWISSVALILFWESAFPTKRRKKVKIRLWPRDDWHYEVIFFSFRHSTFICIFTEKAKLVSHWAETERIFFSFNCFNRKTNENITDEKRSLNTSGI